MFLIGRKINYKLLEDRVSFLNTLHMEVRAYEEHRFVFSLRRHQFKFFQ